MATIRIILRKQKLKKDGTAPLYLRITKERKTTFTKLGYAIRPDQWDENREVVKKNYPNSAYLNNYLSKELEKANALLLKLDIGEVHLSNSEIKDRLSGKQAAQATFNALAKDYLDTLQVTKKFSQHSADASRIKHITDFWGVKIAFKEITQQEINKLRTFLKARYNHSERTIVNHLILIRTLYNKAIAYGYVNQDSYPFGKNGISVKIPQSQKIGLTAEEIKTLETIELEKGSNLDHARNIFLSSFYLAGARISDLLRIKWSDMQDDRMYYVMGKNNKPGSIKISAKLQRIFDQYETKLNKDSYVFPELNKADPKDERDLHVKIRTATRKFNRHLHQLAEKAQIEKKLTNHIARHSFGAISGDRIPVQMLQKLYRHSDINTTINYQSSFINKDTDDALDKVIGT